MNINKDVKEFLVDFKKIDPSPNTRVFTHPKFIDNKKDIIIKNLDLINSNFFMSLNQMIF